jgi:hypothetical protein
VPCWLISTRHHCVVSDDSEDIGGLNLDILCKIAFSLTAFTNSSPELAKMCKPVTNPIEANNATGINTKKLVSNINSLHSGICKSVHSLFHYLFVNGYDNESSLFLIVLELDEDNDFGAFCFDSTLTSNESFADFSILLLLLLLSGNTSSIFHNMTS